MRISTTFSHMRISGLFQAFTATQITNSDKKEEDRHYNKYKITHTTLPLKVPSTPAHRLHVIARTGKRHARRISMQYHGPRFSAPPSYRRFSIARWQRHQPFVTAFDEQEEFSEIGLRK